MVDAFQSVADAVADLMGFSKVTCSQLTGCGPQGFILGLIVVIVMVVVLTMVLGEHAKGFGLVLVGIVGFIFVVMVGWWPMWAVVFIALIVAFLIFKPFGGDSSVGGM